MEFSPPSRPTPCDVGATIRRARQANRWTLAQLGARTGYSASQVSRYERGLAQITVTVLHQFAAALDVSAQTLGLVPPEPLPAVRHVPLAATTARSSRATVAGEVRVEDDPVRRRQLLANLVVTVAAAAGSSFSGSSVAQAGRASTGDLLITRVRDAMLGLNPTSTPIPPRELPAVLAAALADFHQCRYGRLANALPRLIRSGHAASGEAGEEPETSRMLAEVYTLVTRMLIKLDDQQLGWLAADRARLIATGADAPLIAAEAARNLAVLARKAGWHDQAAVIALAAADNPDLRGNDPAKTAKRGQLMISAAYTFAKHGDRQTMRELTNDAAAIAARLGGRTLLRDHGGGFSPATVTLHRISAEYSIGEPGVAIAAARHVPPASLPSTERRSRYYTDVARAYAQWGRRDECLRALLAAERAAPEETHGRPAIRDLVSGLLVSGPTKPELRGLAARCGIA